jgi:hypothetical protein
MVIIVRNGFAEMYYNDSQWADTEGLLAGEEGTGYQVPNSTLKDYNILGDAEYEDVSTGQIVPGTDPMTEAEVQAVATSSGFSIADYSF